METNKENEEKEQPISSETTTYRTMLKENAMLVSALFEAYPELKNFERDVKAIVETYLLTYENRKSLPKILEILKDKSIDPQTKADWFIKMKKLILTQNNLNCLDAIPIGIILSIDMHSHAAQAALNVKHTKIRQEEFNAAGISTHEKNSDIELKHPMVPEIDVTVLHQGGKFCWFRIKLSCVIDVSQLNLAYSPVHYYFYTDRIVELYYYREVRNYKDFYLTTMANLNSSEFVSHIYFFSDCRLVEKLESKVNQFSNILKFLYCYRMNSASFSITNEDDQEHVFKLLIRTTVFLYRRNFNMGSEELDTPFTALTGERAHINVRRFLSEDTVYSVNNARDGLILGTGTQLGGINPHELVFLHNGHVE
ncbi:uncharacterized LOC118073682 [Chelonus insularis]|uniref:uncharacterized LOC118073682 n=1 Tax=Chelonus insularis TaxID=460826 RepID=UPI00158F43F0|nr:uncharacterized LOC118073682 [Chelonus insularis]KAG8148298.1 putative RNA polymerase subunit p47 [Chelonus insularis]